MNKFVNSLGMGNTYTVNGAGAYASSGSALVDFFYIIGSARNLSIDQVIRSFELSMLEDKLATLKCLFWARDIRGGAGERQVFRDLIAHIDMKYPELVRKNIKLIPEYGRWDDLWNSIQSTLNRGKMKALIAETLTHQTDGWQLLGKWLPRQGTFAGEMREYMKLTPKEWRKLVVASSQTVEQNMCAKQWDKINHEHTPSLAASRYMNAFNRHSVNGDDRGNYQDYKKKLESGEAKINAGAIFPHEIAANAKRNVGDDIIINAQWNALENFMENSSERILPMIDVSGSMSCSVGGNPSMSCMDAAVGLGTYIALKQPGEFAGTYLTFHTVPSLMRADPSQGIRNMLSNIYDSPWGGNTDLAAAFEVVLQHGISQRVPSTEMPSMIIILSDMQMNQADSSFNPTMHEMIKQKYQNSGYNMPKLVFWNLNNVYGTSEAGATTDNTMLVSGFSPAILKAVVECAEMPAPPTPLELVMQVLDSPRYGRISL